MDTSFGTRLRKERKKHSLSTQNIAKMCGVSRSFITLIENNKRLPGKKLLPKIATALNLETKIVLNWYLEDISRKMEKDLGAN